MDEVDLVVIQGQPSELVKHRVLKDTSQQIKNSERTKIGQDCTDLVATMEGTSGDGGDVVLVQVQVLQLPQLLQGTRWNLPDDQSQNTRVDWVESSSVLDKIRN